MVRESGILWDHKTNILVFEEEKKIVLLLVTFVQL